MATSQIPLTGGPDKADLLRAVSNPGQHLHASFGTPDGLLEAHIDAIEERGSDGVDFTVWGHLASSDLRVPTSPAPTTAKRGPVAWR